ncbi:MAG: indolepyruvate ferredoxin oxidoreductase subunit alpha [Spirochaetota bacterium]|nr:MAG: indolepyruvate ferredoxin oxidoreductase subunit alpha [Spirochaetota bacterium]
MKKLLSGNEAIARGAYEYGVKVACGYPGTPSTEILENISQYSEIYSEWSPNEKVALEVAIGAAMTGIRTMATMKHVGLNVASDPLMTCSYTGIEGGLVVVVCDDPGMHSSQNEQDSRNYARFAKVPLFEPSDSQEAKRFIRLALDTSERFDTPVIIRSTTRISHSKGVVSCSKRSFKDREAVYKHKPEKYLMVPLYARQRRVALEQRLEKLKAFSNSFVENKMIMRDSLLGIVTSSISYQYVEETFREASILKIGMSYPFPDELIRKFSEQVKNILVVEELDPFMTEHLKTLGIVPIGEELIPRIGELNPDILEDIKSRLKLNGKTLAVRTKVRSKDRKKITPSSIKLPNRPPVLCPGCPHRSVFYLLKKYKPVIIGDIGCYSLGGLAPLDNMDAIICMGAGISAAVGVAKSGLKRPVVGVIGDSTFFHSGITGLLNIGYNGGDLTIIVLDNRVTAMTGHQEHPGSGKTLKGEDTFKASIERFAVAAGIERVKVFDPHDMEETKKMLEQEIKTSSPSLLVARRQCILTDRDREIRTFQVVPDKCKACGNCLKLGCPAIEKNETEDKNWLASINTSLCSGCSLCVQLCPFDAIER